MAAVQNCTDGALPEGSKVGDKAKLISDWLDG